MIDQFNRLLGVPRHPRPSWFYTRALLAGVQAPIYLGVSVLFQSQWFGQLALWMILWSFYSLLRGLWAARH